MCTQIDGQNHKNTGVILAIFHKRTSRRARTYFDGPLEYTAKIFSLKTSLTNNKQWMQNRTKIIHSRLFLFAQVSQKKTIIAIVKQNKSRLLAPKPCSALSEENKITKRERCREKKRNKCGLLPNPPRTPVWSFLREKKIDP